MQPNIDLQQLQAFLQCDTLEACNVLEIIMANKRAKIKKLHTYAITPASPRTKYWTTYFKRENELWFYVEVFDPLRLEHCTKR